QRGLPFVRHPVPGGNRSARGPGTSRRECRCTNGYSRSRLLTNRVKRDKFRHAEAAFPMKLSIVIPCYNEKNTIRSIIDAVCAAPYAAKEIIVVDDFSNDGTRKILTNELASRIEKLVFHESNQGKGAALRSGVKLAT